MAHVNHTIPGEHSMKRCEDGEGEGPDGGGEEHSADRADDNQSAPPAPRRAPDGGEGQHEGTMKANPRETLQVFRRFPQFFPTKRPTTKDEVHPQAQ